MTSVRSTLSFATLNSTYELDLTGRRVRRLDGRFDPTPRQGPDGEWKTFTDVTPVMVGVPVTIVWRVDEVDGTRVARTLVTSDVVAILS